MLGTLERLAIEKGVLSTLLLGGTKDLKRLPPFFDCDLFQDAIHKAIFNAICRLVKEKDEFTLADVIHAIPSFFETINEITTDRIDLGESLPTEAAKLYAAIVQTERVVSLSQSIITAKCVAASKPPTGLTLISGTQIDAQEFAKPGDLISNLIRAKSLNFLAGEEGSGKSIFATNLALSVALGQKTFLNWRIERTGRVIYLNNEMFLEDSANRIKQMISAVSDKEALKNLVLVPESTRPLVEIFDEFRKVITDQKPILFIVDCLYYAHNQEEKDSSKMKAIIRMLQSLRDELGLCVLVLHHTRKGSKDERMHNDLMRGAGVFGAAADTVLMLRRSPLDESKRILKATKLRHSGDDYRKSRLISISPETLWFQDEGETTEEEQLLPATQVQRNVHFDFDSIFESQEELVFREIVSRCESRGYSEKTLQRAVKKAMDEGKLLKTRHGSYRLATVKAEVPAP